MDMYWLRRRLRSEIQGLKCVIGNKKSKKIIKLSYVAYQVSRVIYNPYYLATLAHRHIFKNLI